MARNILFEAAPINPATGLTTTIRLSSAGSDATGTQLDGYQWLPILISGPTISMNIFGQGQVKDPEISYGDVQFFLSEKHDTLDLSSHMFWRAIDRQHPAYSPELNRQFGGLIESLYQKIDDAVGRAQAALSPGDWLLVMSDHGFCSFRRQFNLNSWLLSQRLLRTSGPTVILAREF